MEKDVGDRDGTCTRATSRRRSEKKPLTSGDAVAIAAVVADVVASQKQCTLLLQNYTHFWHKMYTNHQTRIEREFFAK